MAMAENDKRAVIILGAVLLIAVLAWFFLLRGGDEELAPVTAPTTSTVDSGTTPSPDAGEPSPAQTQAPQAGLPPIGGRDIFSPLPALSPSLSPSASVAASPSASP